LVQALVDLVGLGSGLLRYARNDGAAGVKILLLIQIDYDGVGAEVRDEGAGDLYGG
jgi:hypothetical protein